MYVNIDSTDVELHHIARRIAYNSGNAMLGDFLLQYLALERRVLQLEESVSDMAALRARLEKLESGTPPHLARVERRDTAVTRR
jgi:hypothetical protein